MATLSTTMSMASSPAILDPSRPQAAPTSTVQPCVGLPRLLPPQILSQTRPPSRQSWKTMASCRNLARNVVSMATGDTSVEVGPDVSEVLKPIQDTWEKLDDKYAVASLAFAGIVALWASTGMISAIDRLPLVPGILELVGIGYTGWFTYRNLVFKPDREALIEKIKEKYEAIIGSS
ncbi:hypothetical protein AMTRI_Chr09g37060 [Amborella trichopoda]